MMSRPLALIVSVVAVPLVAVPLLGSSIAHAQAPGEYAPEPIAPAPIASNPCAAGPQVDPLARRWSVALGIGSFVVAPEDAPEGSETKFKNTEFAVRYRATRRLELEMILAGGRQMLDDDVEGELANGSFFLGARYRFRPERKWSWWLGAALGGTVIAHHESDEHAREAATRPAAALGIGIERRFRRLALQAELRSFGFGPRKDQERGATPVATPPPMPTTPTSPDDPSPDGGGGMEPPSDQPLPPKDSVGEPEKLRGASFTINLSYYF